MYECTFPFWAIAIGAAVCFALVAGYINIYVPHSLVSDSINGCLEGPLEIHAKERFSTHRITYVFIGSSILTVILFLWYYFPLHPFSNNTFSIWSGIGILVVTFFVIFLLSALLILLYCAAALIHMRVLTKKFSRLYETSNVYITLSCEE